MNKTAKIGDTIVSKSISFSGITIGKRYIVKDVNEAEITIYKDDGTELKLPRNVVNYNEYFDHISVNL